MPFVLDHEQLMQQAPNKRSLTDQPQPELSSDVHRGQSGSQSQIQAPELTPDIQHVLNGWAGQSEPTHANTVARNKQATGAEPSPFSVSHFAQQGMQASRVSLPYQRQLESSFGQPLGNIPVFQGAPANAAANALNANAYAYQGAIVLGDSGGDMRTVGEETAHVLQGRQGGLSSGRALTEAGGSVEKEAGAAADAVVAGRSVGSLNAGLGNSQVARNTDSDQIKSTSAAFDIKGGSDKNALSTVNNKLDSFASGPGAQLDGDVSAGRVDGGVQASLNVAGKATLVEINKTFEFEVPFNVLGEQIDARITFLVRGMAGIEASAALEGKAGSSFFKNVGGGMPKFDKAGFEAATKTKVDSSSGKGTVDQPVEATASLNAEAFAGAKITLGAGATLRWDKKDKAHYKPKLKDAADLAIDMVTGSVPGASWVLKKMGATEAVEWILDHVFGWGGPGKIPVIGAEADLEGTAGAGAKFIGELSLAGGCIKVACDASATWGLGCGGRVDLTVDLLEGGKFALIMLSEFRNAADAFIKKKVSEIGSSPVQAFKSGWSSIRGFLDITADDKVREAVAAGADRLADAQSRGGMIRALVSGWTGSDDQSAIVKILQNASADGTIADVVAAAGGKGYVLSDLSGDAHAEASTLVG